MIDILGFSGFVPNPFSPLSAGYDCSLVVSKSSLTLRYPPVSLYGQCCSTALLVTSLLRSRVALFRSITMHLTINVISLIGSVMVKSGLVEVISLSAKISLLSCSVV